SGMVTKSEICASGALGSASAVCSAWQNSPGHYANIMLTDITSMGIGCWFCSIDGNNYTYWVVTFQ
ncbi:MAG: CAP domain-containing protein, partial [Subdoligranulum sp.]|nr:CAP domain-containing protein [Subdoligranulum sp.]